MNQREIPTIYNKEGVVPGIVPINMERSRRYECNVNRALETYVSDKHGFVGTLMNMREMRIREIFDLKMAEIKASQERRDIEVLVTDFNQRLTTKRMEADRLRTLTHVEHKRKNRAIEQQFNRKIRAIEATNFTMETQLAHNHHVLERYKRKYILLDKKFWHRAKHLKIMLELKQKIAGLLKYQTETKAALDHPLQTVKDLRHELADQYTILQQEHNLKLREIDEGIDEFALQEKTKIYDKLDKIKLTPETDAVGDRKHYLYLDFESWTKSEVGVDTIMAVEDETIKQMKEVIFKTIPNFQTIGDEDSETR